MPKPKPPYPPEFRARIVELAGSGRRACAPDASTGRSEARFFFLLAAILVCCGCSSTRREGGAAVEGEPTYPGRTWGPEASPAEAGWSVEGLKAARRYSGTLDTDAAVVVVHGRVIDHWGDLSAKFNVASVRKSLLSALYGKHIASGRVRFGQTLSELGIDDNEPSLTAEEKQATVRDLLMARSGVYHPALYESQNMKRTRPARHSHAHGSFWYYNNWDFNVLGAILERAARNSLFREFKEQIADPIEMEDYAVADGEYVMGPDSVYPAYPFRMSARDLARFGLLFLRHGLWRGKQVVAEEWVRESTTTYSDAGLYPGEGGGWAGGYGYLWWTTIDDRHFPNVRMPGGSFSARGAGGQYLVVVPAFDLVFVHLANNRDVAGREVSVAQFSRLLQMVIDAGPAARSVGKSGDDAQRTASGASVR